MIPGIVSDDGTPLTPVMVPATLDPANKGAGVVLSNADLTATKTTGGTGWKMARSTVGLTTGKYYFEATWDEFSGSFTGIGIGDASASVENFYGVDAHGLILINNGEVYASGALLTTIQSSSEGQVSGIAIDVDAKLIWFRTAGGNWNNNGSADPATGTGGLSFPGSGTFYAGVGVQTSPNDQMTANFGPTFVGTPPAGFGLIASEGAPGIFGLSGITVDA